MLSNHIHSALDQVRMLRQLLLERQRFRGYSGEARIFSGFVAASAACVLTFGHFSDTPQVHLTAWLIVFVLALFINYGAVMYWFLNDPVVSRDWRKLKPTIDVFPPLIVGAIFSIAMILKGDYSYLFAIWMCLYGLANLASRHVLPGMIGGVGILYIITGAFCLFSPHVGFTSPWAMGVTFLVGETIAGLILRIDQHRNLNFEQESNHSLTGDC